MLMTAMPYYGRLTVATATLHHVLCKCMGAYAERALGLGLGLGLRRRLRLRLRVWVRARARDRVSVRDRVRVLWPYLLRLS